MRQKLEFIAALLFLAGLIVVSRNVSKYVMSEEVETKSCTVMIDPGHGGKDPGKVGVNDALEKDINLSIALKVKELLKKDNIEATLTREEDMMYAKESDSNKKVQDMKTRVKMINDAKPKLAVSIHQNSYHESGVSGSQVFYYANSKEGQNAAAVMQEALKVCDTKNNRAPKANDSYYMLKRTQVTTIIIECGFLSNPDDAALLVTEDYQNKMASAIADGIKAWVVK